MEGNELDSPVLSPASHISRVVPVSFLPVHTGSLAGSRTSPPETAKRRHLREDGVASAAEMAIRRLRFIDNFVSEGMDWKEVEQRFDGLALNRPGLAPFVRVSDFSYCIGMQQTPEFANGLLGALRGKRDRNSGITKSELCNYWRRITDSCFNSRMRIFFNLCDKDRDGRITKMDIKQVILLSASTNKLSMSEEEAQEYAALIMEELDDEDLGYIEHHQLETLFKVCISYDFHSNSRIPMMTYTPDRDDTCHDKKSTIEIFFRTYWRRAWIVTLWLIICFALFAWKFTQYSHRKAFEVMGYCLCTAKGAAETLKFNMALILLPVCRNTMTWLRMNNSINSVVPFNDNINFHKLIAGGIVIGVILHGGTHLACDFPRISGCDSSVFQNTIAARFGNQQPSYIQILATTEVATGISMVILMIVAFSLATKWPRRQSKVLPRSVREVTGFNAFWYSHHLFILVYALLIIHSMFLFLTDKVIEKTTWIYIAIPVLLYAGERMYRAIRSGFCHVGILQATIYPGKVLFLKFSKPEWFNYKSGMYIYVQCPQISPLEWHPFSLTSGPEDDQLSVHIRTLGDWSYQIYSLFQEAIVSGDVEYPKIYIDGPYGAASQDHVKYDIVVLIGLGIGATPYISILKDVLHRFKTQHHDDDSLQHKVNGGECCATKGPSKAYLYWVTREQGSFVWFKDVLTETSKIKQKQDVVEMHNFLSSVYQDGDARSAIISAIQALHHSKKGIDIVSKTPVRTHFGRPNWFRIFSNLAHRHKRERIGVFYCGPSLLARELERLCTKFSTQTTTRFVFHKENY